MGSATRQALESSTAALVALGTKVDFATGEQLLQSGRVIGGSSQLAAALVDHSADSDDKRSIINAVFSSLTDGAKSVLGAVVSARWSSDDDMLEAIEELGIRAIASSAPQALSIESELFAVAAAVSSDADLELAVGSKLGAADQKVALLGRLLGSKVSAQSLVILEHLVQQPRGRRIGELISHAASIVADEAGMTVATVTTAAPLSTAQLDRLIAGLSAQHGRGLRVNHVIDPSLIGGVRVQIGDNVIDGSIAARLNALRLQLAG
jgi:F-type H+-transporting ATPase subunit delta